MPALEHRGANLFVTLLIVAFLTAMAVSFGVLRLFDRPVASILRRIVAEELEPRYWLVRRG